jgi:hypothetical protein
MPELFHGPYSFVPRGCLFLMDARVVPRTLRFVPVDARVVPLILRFCSSWMPELFHRPTFCSPWMPELFHGPYGFVPGGFHSCSMDSIVLFPVDARFVPLMQFLFPVLTRFGPRTQYHCSPSRRDLFLERNFLFHE